VLRLMLMNIQEALEGTREGESGVAEAPGPRAMDLAPLPVAIRVDTALPVSGRGNMNISKLIWLSPEPEGIPPKRLEAMLCPN
jgi:hypothetical protein